ncbi:MAG: adenylate/guanylate cyclase domain-containing protein [Ignavibacteria bacterium]|jgi:class 3 adenylate cyclase
MLLTYFKIKKIKRVLFISVVCSISLAILFLIGKGKFDHLKYVLPGSFILGLPVGIFEEFIFAVRLKKFSWHLIFVIKIVVYLSFAASLILSSLYFSVLLGIMKLPRFYEFLFNGEFLNSIIYTAIVYDLIIVLNQDEKLLERDVLYFHGYGKYVKPEIEFRIFMFLDLISSTELAEQIGKENFFYLINDFYHDISEPVLESSAHIYQYVGDEVVFTWSFKEGMKDSNCIMLFYRIEELIHKRESYYLERYGVVPKFKAGLHCGDIMVSVIGEIKKELVFCGDVVNTTARIRSQCTKLNEKFLASKKVIDMIEIPANIKLKSIGEVTLKGKRNHNFLYSISSI